jgi:hypothetical protein
MFWITRPQFGPASARILLATVRDLGVAEMELSSCFRGAVMRVVAHGLDAQSMPDVADCLQQTRCGPPKAQQKSPRA